MNEVKYNVYLIRIDNFKAVGRIASNVEPSDVNTIENNSMKRYNTDDYFIAGYEVGGDRDKELSKDLNRLLSKNPKNVENQMAY